MIINRWIACVFLTTTVVIGCKTQQAVRYERGITLQQPFDRAAYINPADLGAPVSIKAIEDTSFSASGFVPPRVAGGMQQAFQQVKYPPKALQAGIGGRVRLRLYINESAILQRVEVLQAPDPLLVQAAIDAAQKWTYVAATYSGSPTNAFIEVPVNFRTQETSAAVN